MQLFEDSSKLVIRLYLVNSGTDLVADKRERVLSEEYPGKHQSHLAHNRSGIVYPVILKDGKVCGNWNPSDLTLEFFDGQSADSKFFDGQ